MFVLGPPCISTKQRLNNHYALPRINQQNEAIQQFILFVKDFNFNFNKSIYRLHVKVFFL